MPASAEFDYTMTRVFAAPLRIVWDCHVQPEHLRNWWGRHGSTLTVCEVDFRVGGRWRFVTRTAEGREFAFYGEYREIVPYEKFVQTFDFDGNPGDAGLETYGFSEREGKTTLASTAHFPSAKIRDLVLQTGMEEGAREIWDRLDALLRTQV